MDSTWGKGLLGSYWLILRWEYHSALSCRRPPSSYNQVPSHNLCSLPSWQKVNETSVASWRKGSRECEGPRPGDLGLSFTPARHESLAGQGIPKEPFGAPCMIRETHLQLVFHLSGLTRMHQIQTSHLSCAGRWWRRCTVTSVHTNPAAPLWGFTEQWRHSVVTLLHCNISRSLPSNVFLLRSPLTVSIWYLFIWKCWS